MISLNNIILSDLELIRYDESLNVGLMPDIY